LLVTFVFTVFVFALGASDAAFCQGGNSSGYQLTIYADEGTDSLEPFGHVFIGLSDGQSTEYLGWNPSNHVEDESKYISQCEWDVRKTYNITKSGYEKALQVINEWNTSKLKIYNVTRPGFHCGDFAEAVAKAAGVSIDLSWQITRGGRNRPGLFGEYLREHGAEVSADTYYVNNYVNTRILIRRGDKVMVKASGRVNFGLLAGSGGPEGVDFGTDYNYISVCEHGCLIGRIHAPGGDEGWACIGNETEEISERTGILELDVNDNDPDNNKGKFIVEVKICRSR
jgi:hypothetical protein